MTVQGLILFILGILFIILGASLMIYSSLAKRREVEAKGTKDVDGGILKNILDFVLEIVKLIAGLIPEDKVAQVGFILIILGIILALIPVLVPGL